MNKIKYNSKTTLKNAVSLKIIVIAITILTISCTKECPICFTPPQELVIKIIDAKDSTDLLFTGYYNADSISIFYYNNDSKQFLEHEIYSDTASKESFLVSHDISWKSVEGFKDFYLSLNYVETDMIFLNVEKKTDECCTYHNWKSFKINNIEIKNSKDYNNYCYYIMK